MGLHARCAAGLQLLAAAAEQEGIAALQPHHHQPFQGQGHEQTINIVLRQDVARLALAHIDQPRIGPRQVQNGRRG